MSSCCGDRGNKEKSREIPDDIEPCCNIRGPRCLCLPYNDGFLIASQILSILATLLSWVWYTTLVISVLGMILIQILWCCRQGSNAVYGSVVVATFSSLASIGLGIFVVVVMTQYRNCSVFFMFLNDEKEIDEDIGEYEVQNDIMLSFDEDDTLIGLSDSNAFDAYGLPSSYEIFDTDYCDNEIIWAIIAIFSGVLWAASAGFLFHFVKSRRHGKWEEQYSSQNGKNNKGTGDATTTTVVTNDNRYNISSNNYAVEMAPQPPSPGGRGGSTIATDDLPSKPDRKSVV